MQTQEHVREHELGNLLRYWRHQRGKSQLDLSLDTGISQRHLSFVESGRACPAETCCRSFQRSWTFRCASDRMLLQQEPHPALVLDRYWNVIRTNEAAPRFFGSFVDLEARQRPRNLLDLMRPGGRSCLRRSFVSISFVAVILVYPTAYNDVAHLPNVSRLMLLSICFRIQIDIIDPSGTL